MHINLIMNANDIDFHQLRVKICSFYYVRTLNITTDRAVSAFTAAKLLNCIPPQFMSPLLLSISKNSHDVLRDSLEKCKRVDLKLKDPMVGTKRQSLPSEQAERITKKMKEFHNEDGISRSLIDKKIVDGSDYVEFKEVDCLLGKNVKESSDVSKNIGKTLAPLFTESCVKFDFFFVLITQFEVYYRNDNEIDASAISTPHEPYHEFPVGFIKDKNEKGKTWFEISIFYQRYEILVTGGVLGETAASELKPFLGPSVPLSVLTSQHRRSTSCILINHSKPGFLMRERSLRNWMKPSSSFKWAVISKRFAGKEFLTENPLNITTGKNKTMILTSFVLSCIVNNKFSERDYQKALDLLTEISFSNLPVNSKIKSVTSLRRKLTKKAPNYNLTVINALISLEENVGKSPRNVISAETAVALSSKLYSHTRYLNKKALNRYKA